MIFEPADLQKLWRPVDQTSEKSGQAIVIGGSSLFHGAPVLSLTAATRLVGMVFFASPEPYMKQMAVELKSRLSAFIWVPWDQVDAYIEKSDAALVGPGFMRYSNEGDPGHETDNAGVYTRSVTQRLLTSFADKQWVIDAGSLQVMEPEWIPKNAIITPNQKEFEMLFGVEYTVEHVHEMARKYRCVIVGKNHVTLVSNGHEYYEVHGGNKGLEKGGVGDTLAGVTLGLVTKNDPLLAAAAASYIVKQASERLFERVGFGFNADDLAGEIFATKKALVGF